MPLRPAFRCALVSSVSIRSAISDRRRAVVAAHFSAPFRTHQQTIARAVAPPSAFFAESETIRRPAIIPDPPQRREPAPEPPSNRGRQPRMRILQPARQQVLFTCRVKRQHLSIALSSAAQGSIVRQTSVPDVRVAATVHQQIHFARQSRQRRHSHAPRIIFQHQLRNKNRIAQIRKWIVECLPRMDPSEDI